MVNVSHLVKKYVDENPFIAEAMQRGIISNPGLAEELKPGFEKEIKKKIKLPSIVMALRRYGEELESKIPNKKKAKLTSELSLKSGLCVIGVKNTRTASKVIEKIQQMVDYEKGDTLNISRGNTNIAIIINEQYKEKILSMLKKEDLIEQENKLVSVTITFSKEYFDTPGVIFAVIRRLAWHNINMVELISATKELSVIIRKKDAAKTYSILQELMS
ncbi:MAG: hypothetical protein ABH828_02995 [archaeon]